MDQKWIEEQTDPLTTARGILIALGISLVIDALLVWAIWG